MAENSKIEWCHHTFNPWIGCTKVSAGCDNCYAEAMMDRRLGRARWGHGQPRQRTSDSYWRQPINWDTKAWEAGERHRVFCASLADVFDSEVPESWRSDLFALIEATPHLDWLLLTKRPTLAAVHSSRNRWPSNIWIGTSAENQQMWDARLPVILRLRRPVVRFVSCEPLLGPIDRICHRMRPRPGARLNDFYPDWIIVGGESGPGARPAHPDWFRSLRDQCQAAGVAFFMKQLSGERGRAIKDIAKFPEDLQIREYPNG